MNQSLRKRARVQKIGDREFETMEAAGPSGSTSKALDDVVLQQVIGSTWAGHADKDYQQTQVHASVGALQGIEARDEIEGMLAAQMVATHNAAMECYRRAMIPEQPHIGRDSNLNHASKLVRSYATLVQALDKHRGKGQQTVRVEHVHVHSGGQAIVGQVGGQMPSLESDPMQKIGLLEEGHSLAEMALLTTREGVSK